MNNGMRRQTTAAAAASPVVVLQRSRLRHPDTTVAASALITAAAAATQHVVAVPPPRTKLLPPVPILLSREQQDRLDRMAFNAQCITARAPLEANELAHVRLQRWRELSRIESGHFSCDRAHADYAIATLDIDDPERLIPREKPIVANVEYAANLNDLDKVVDPDCNISMVMPHDCERPVIAELVSACVPYDAVAILVQEYVVKANAPFNEGRPQTHPFLDVDRDIAATMRELISRRIIVNLTYQCWGQDADFSRSKSEHIGRDFRIRYPQMFDSIIVRFCIRWLELNHANHPSRYAHLDVVDSRDPDARIANIVAVRMMRRLGVTAPTAQMDIGREDEKEEEIVLPYMDPTAKDGFLGRNPPKETQQPGDLFLDYPMDMASRNPARMHISRFHLLVTESCMNILLRRQAMIARDTLPTENVAVRQQQQQPQDQSAAAAGGAAAGPQ